MIAWRGAGGLVGIMLVRCTLWLIFELAPGGGDRGGGGGPGGRRPKDDAASVPGLPLPVRSATQRGAANSRCNRGNPLSLHVTGPEDPDPAAPNRPENSMENPFRRHSGAQSPGYRKALRLLQSLSARLLATIDQRFLQRIHGHTL